MESEISDCLNKLSLVSPPSKANLYTHLHELVADYKIVCLKGSFFISIVLSPGDSSLRSE